MKSILLSLILFATCSHIVLSQNFNEILARPTDTSITVSVLFDQAVDLYVEFGTTQGIYPFSTLIISNFSGTPDEIDLQNLLPNTKYYYRTRYRPTGQGTFLSRTEHSFYTQRAPGSIFTFNVESDVHLYDKKGCSNLFNICLANQAADNPDFMIDMGDTYGDDRDVPTMTSGLSDTLHKNYRPILGAVCHSIPFYFCMGNHEGEFDYYLPQSPPNNIAVWGTLWRKFYFPNPYPNNFYSGNTDVESYGMGNPENYYAWTWGDALFVVLDAYRYQCDTTAKPRKWDWTLGFPQYTWLKNTLENSTAQYKFVFCHQILGQVRGGILEAPFYEWGGLDGNGNNLFSTKRPGWAKPIHQLFVDNGVDIFFHGHDHVFAHEELDGVIYQELPMPSDSTYQIGMLANADAYASDSLDGSGHLRVMVSPACVQVDYVRAYLPADTVSGVHHNREVAFSYTIGNCPIVATEEQTTETSISIYPNPAKDHLSIILPVNSQNPRISFINTLGQIIMQTISTEIDISGIAEGLYFVNIRTNMCEYNKKVIIKR